MQPLVIQKEICVEKVWNVFVGGLTLLWLLFVISLRAKSRQLLWNIYKSSGRMNSAGKLVSIRIGLGVHTSCWKSTRSIKLLNLVSFTFSKQRIIKIALHWSVSLYRHGSCWCWIGSWILVSGSSQYCAIKSLRWRLCSGHRFASIQFFSNHRCKSYQNS